MTDPLDQDLIKCQDMLLEKHPDHYYAALFTAQDLRPQVTALFTLLRDIRDIPRSSQEQQVIQTKLQWWQDELDRLHQGTPRHPATKILHQHCQNLIGSQSKALFDTLLDGVAMDIQYDAYPSKTELLILLRKLGGSSGELLGHFSGQSEEREAWHRPAILLEQLERNQDFLAHLAAGRLYLPLDQLERAGVTPQDLAQHPLENSVAEKVQSLISTTHEELLRDPQSLTGDLKGASASLTILLRLRLKQQQKQAQKPPLASTPLHPIQRLWISWRTARQFSTKK